MRNPTLHGLLEAFTNDAALRLSVATTDGEGIPFEVSATDAGGQGRRRGIPLYCYRPLTGDFIRSHLGLLAALPTYAPVARALEHAHGTDAYLQARGELAFADPRERADAALRLFLSRVFEDRSEFVYDHVRFRLAYDELERSLYHGMCVAELVAPLVGLELDPGTDELVLGDGLSIVRARALGQPPVALWSADRSLGDAASEVGDGLLLVLRIARSRSDEPPVAIARERFGGLLTALRLFDAGGFAIGRVGFWRTDDGAWTPVAIGTGGRPAPAIFVPAAQEDELRAFANLIARRLPGVAAGEVGWALARFEMGCERVRVRDALTDYLLAARALLEPEGPGSGRLAQRLSVICAQPEDRAELAERTARVVALEREIVGGTDDPGARPRPERQIDEFAGHLRAILRDVLCGHLDADVRGIADDLLAQAAGAL